MPERCDANTPRHCPDTRAGRVAQRRDPLTSPPRWDSLGYRGARRAADRIGQRLFRRQGRYIGPTAESGAAHTLRA
jgi:hypothetical protein